MQNQIMWPLWQNGDRGRSRDSVADPRGQQSLRLQAS
jgi:hypothetical protein